MFPTEHQLQEFFSRPPNFRIIRSLPRLVENGEVTNINFAEFLNNPDRFLRKMELSAVADLKYLRKIGVRGLLELARFDEVDEKFDPDRFEINGRGCESIKFQLVRPECECPISTEEMKKIIDGRQLRSSDMIRTLIFAIKYPHKQEQFSIGALNALWVNPRGERLVAVLGSKKVGNVLKRTLQLVHEECFWDEDCRLLTEEP